MGDGSTPSREFLLGCGIAALAVALPCLWIASLEWFTRDDFAFLAYVQAGDSWSWRRVFLPLEERFWPFYRPLGMETYFYLGFRLFGLDAFGYFSVSLAVHFGSGALVYRIGRQLGFDARVAVVTALLAVSRHPSLGEIFYGSIFHYLISILFTLASITCFLDHVGGRGRRWQLASCLALGLALLCNEVNASTPALLVLAALGTRPLERDFTRRVMRAVGPQLVLVVLYLAFRFLLLPPLEIRPLHTPVLGPHVVRNAGIHLLYVFGGMPLLVATLGLTSALGVVLVTSSGARGQGARLGRLAALTLAWSAVAVAPFALLPFPQPRYAMMTAVPLCLFFGALLDSIWRSYGPLHPRVLEVGFVVALFAAIPFGVLTDRALDPRGRHPRRIVEAIEARRPAVPANARLVLLYGAPELAQHDDAMAFRYLAYNGMVVDAVYPETTMSLRFHDLTQRPPRGVIRAGNLYFELSPGFEVEPASRGLLERELPRGVESIR
jgi:hypothetical protein